MLTNVSRPVGVVTLVFERASRNAGRLEASGVPRVRWLRPAARVNTVRVRRLKDLALRTSLPETPIVKKLPGQHFKYAGRIVDTGIRRTSGL